MNLPMVAADVRGRSALRITRFRFLIGGYGNGVQSANLGWEKSLPEAGQMPGISFFRIAGFQSASAAGTGTLGHLEAKTGYKTTAISRRERAILSRYPDLWHE